MNRKALKDFTFSNGMTVPKGSRVCVPSDAIHNDSEYYPGPHVFNGFRFSEMMVSVGESVNHQLVCITLCLDCDVRLFGLLLGCYQPGLCSFRTRQTCVVRTCALSHSFLQFLRSPGRFFAANELKAMLAYLVITYDVKLENEGVRPPNCWFATSCIPNRTGSVLFRERRI